MLDDPELAELIGDAELYEALIEEVEMLKELTPEIDMEAVGRGEMTPVFFGSAMTNFGAPTLHSPLSTLHPPPSTHTSTLTFTLTRTSPLTLTLTRRGSLPRCLHAAGLVARRALGRGEGRRGP